MTNTYYPEAEHFIKFSIVLRESAIILYSLYVLNLVQEDTVPCVEGFLFGCFPGLGNPGLVMIGAGV